MDTSVSQVLLGAQSADHATRTKAEAFLKEAEHKNFGTFLVTLADHLAGNENNPDSRRLAGLIVKNALFSRDGGTRTQYVDRWTRSVDEQSKNHVRHALVRALSATDPEPRRAAAQAIAKIAVMDLVRPGAWDSLINDLLVSSTTAGEDHVKQASLETLGYICEEAVYGDAMDNVLAEHSNQILTAVVQGMSYSGAANSTEQTIAAVRLAATVALNNTLEFARSQFEIPTERSAIVNTLCKAASSDDVNIRQAAFEGLVKVSEHYYDKLPEYIRDIYTLTENAIRNDIEPVAMQAIEFWSSVAEEEIAISYDVDPGTENAKPTSDRESKQFVMHALPYLLGPIFDSLKKQEDDPLEDGTWTTATAAGACLELLASAAPESILDLVKPFIESNIGDQNNWRSREAAILAFGAVLDGPPRDAVKELVRNAMSVLIETLRKDSNLAVKDTTAWTIGRAVAADRDSTLANLHVLIECLCEILREAESPLFASHVCSAIHNIADNFAEEADQETGALTGYMEFLLSVLLQTAERPDAGESNLRIAAYESVSALFRSVPRDGIVTIKAWLPKLLEKLQVTLQSFGQALSDDDVQNLAEQQGLICGVLTTATHRLQKSDLSAVADQMMHAYLTSFTVSRNGAGSLEDTFLAIGALADVIGGDFNRYMSHVVPYLHQGLSNVMSWQLCGVAVGVTGELSRALGKELVPHAEKFIFLLLEALKSTTLDRTVKPTILSCFGDIAMAVKGDFEKYVKQVMDCMKQAAESSVGMSVAADDFDTLDWIQLLQESVLEAYVGIVSGMRDEGKEEVLMPYVDWVMSFCEVMVERAQPTMPEEMMRPIMGLLGDIGDALPQTVEVMRTKGWLRTIVDHGYKCTDGRTKEMAVWAMNVIFNR